MKGLAQLLTVVLLIVSTQAAAQTGIDNDASGQRPDPQHPVGANMDVPPGWKVRLDKPDPKVVVGKDEGSDIFFVSMTPGWHITSGPRAIYYHPANMAKGNFSAHTGIYLFPPGDRNEAYGLFVGGRNLEGDNQEYVYFVIRRSGEFLIKRRSGDATEVIHEWTANDAIRPYTAETTGNVHNRLAADAGAESVGFLVNDVEVARLPRKDLDVDGVVGLRINHAMNVHVDDLGVDERD